MNPIKKSYNRRKEEYCEKLITLKKLLLCFDIHSVE